MKSRKMQRDKFLGYACFFCVLIIMFSLAVYFTDVKFTLMYFGVLGAIAFLSVTGMRLTSKSE